jgi:hypothetical protein
LAQQFFAASCLHWFALQESTVQASPSSQSAAVLQQSLFGDSVHVPPLAQEPTAQAFVPLQSAVVRQQNGLDV